MMNKGQNILLRFAAIAVLALLPAATFAQIYGTRDRQIRGTQMGTLLSRIETRTDTFKRSVEISLSRSPLNGTAREDRITDFIADFETATDSLRRTFDGRRDVTNEVNDVLNRALFIDRFMTRNRLAPRAQSDWSAIRTDLNALSRLYGVSWNWNRMPDYRNGQYDNGRYDNGTGRRGFDGRITGTYRLNRTLSDDVNLVLDRSDDAYTVAQRDRVRRNLERRLTSPEMMAIEKVGQTMTMASSLSPQVTFDVDGVARTETTARGRTIRTTATANRDSVEISYVGDRANDFYLTLSPTRDGQLRVTRRLYLENRNETVSVSSVYDKSDDVAHWSQVTTDVPWNAGNNLPDSGNFYIPNGTRLTAELNNLVTTRATQAGDRFTMNVTSPSMTAPR